MGTQFKGMKKYGAKRFRTADLLHAMQALSQLSYSPEPNANECLVFYLALRHGQGSGS